MENSACDASSAPRLKIRTIGAIDCNTPISAGNLTASAELKPNATAEQP
jgi:hypothetical protein